MKRYSLSELNKEVLYLNTLLESEIDEDKQLDLEREIETLQSEIKRRKEKEEEIEK